MFRTCLARWLSSLPLAIMSICQLPYCSGTQTFRAFMTLPLLCVRTVCVDVSRAKEQRLQQLFPDSRLLTFADIWLTTVSDVLVFNRWLPCDVHANVQYGNFLSEGSHSPEPCLLSCSPLSSCIRLSPAGRNSVGECGRVDNSPGQTVV